MTRSRAILSLSAAFLLVVLTVLVVEKTLIGGVVVFARQET